MWAQLLETGVSESPSFIQNAYTALQNCSAARSNWNRWGWD